MALRDIRKVSVREKSVLVRVDYNVKLEKGKLRDTTRLAATVPTLRWLLRQRAKVIIVTHRDRPRGRQEQLSLRPLVSPLERLIGRSVGFVAFPLFSPSTAEAITRLRPGQIALLENIRFEPGEESNDRRVAKRLAELCDLFVNDGFAVSHRAAASVVGVAKFRPAYAGLLLQEEIRALGAVRRRQKRPYVAIIGGAKISTKLGLVRRLLRQADHVLLGGALANTVLRAEGLTIGASLSERAMLKAAKGLTVSNNHLHIPCDVRVTRPHPRPGQPSAVRPVGNVGRDEIIADIGPDTVDLFRRAIDQARTVVWNGPMGLYEVKPFDRGTRAIARAIASSHARSIAGGGETIDAIRSQGLAEKFSFISTGGGAMLEFLEGKTLPGVRAVSIR